MLQEGVGCRKVRMLGQGGVTAPHPTLGDKSWIVHFFVRRLVFRKFFRIFLVWALCLVLF